MIAAEKSPLAPLFQRGVTSSGRLVLISLRIMTEEVGMRRRGLVPKCLLTVVVPLLLLATAAQGGGCWPRPATPLG